MSSSQLPDIGGSPGGGTGSAGGSLPDSGSAAGESGSAGASTPPTWDSRAQTAGNGDWDASNQLPELPGGGPSSGSSDPAGTAGEPGKGGATGELDQVLQDIDGGIMAERGAIQSRADRTAGNSSAPDPSAVAGTGSGGNRPSGGDRPSGGGDAAENDSGQPAPGRIPTVAKAPSAPGRLGGVPKDVADARDDDIIARQLREAAMAETDPEIREKLWEDYRRYKGR
ncbi:MAG: hypothetical protein H6994_07345 [Pseudomonadales bacterium]|nr:hypothetical protein [Pseudomonadales bacterium]